MEWKFTHLIQLETAVVELISFLPSIALIRREHQDCEKWKAKWNETQKQGRIEVS